MTNPPCTEIDPRALDAVTGGGEYESMWGEKGRGWNWDIGDEGRKLIDKIRSSPPKLDKLPRPRRWP